MFALIYGLPGNSLYRGRMQGEEIIRGWGEADIMQANLRDTAEAMRATYVAVNTKNNKFDFQEYPLRPGLESEKRRRQEANYKALKERMAQQQKAMENDN